MNVSYIKTRLNNTVTVNRIVTIHYFEFGRQFVGPREKHDFWEMVYVDKGKAIAEREDEEILLTHGDVLFHAPNEYHSLRAYQSSPNVFIISFVCNSDSMRCFNGAHMPLIQSLRPYIAAIIKEAKSTYVLPQNDIYMRRLVRRETAEIGAEQLIKTYLEQLLIYLIRGIADQKKVFPSRDQMETHLVSQVKQYVTEHVRERLTIPVLCKETGYSKSYLCRIFRQQSGDTIAHYVTVAKIDAAKDMFREESINISEVSDRLNFDNPQYFSRVFRRVTGMTPSEYRRSLKIE